jgi:hypothetical protein
MPAKPETAIERPKHKTDELTTSELTWWRRKLEQAIKDIGENAPVQADLRTALAEVEAEEEARARIAAHNA